MQLCTKILLALALFLALFFDTNAQNWSWSTRLTSSQATSGELAGHSIAAHGSRVLVGALNSPTGGLSMSGKAYMYFKSSNGWISEATLTASNKGAGDKFGQSVALSSTHALVGALNAALPGRPEAGCAYVFMWTGTMWTEQAILTASDTQALDHFGYSVALYESFAMVGSRDDDSATLSDTGSVYFFSYSGAQWTEQAILTSPNSVYDERFGESVSIHSTSAIVGTLPCCWDCYCTRTGVAYIFTQTNPTWSHQATLSVANQESGNHFGISVSLDGDYAVVGARYADPNFVGDAGAAYVFHRQGSSWSLQSELLMNPLTSGSLMGISVSIKGRFALVGGPNAVSQGVTEAGLVGAFYRTDSSWSLFGTWEAVSVSHGTTFGRSVALTDEFAAIGVVGDDFPGYSDAGSVYIFINSDYESPSAIPTQSQSSSISQSMSISQSSSKSISVSPSPTISSSLSVSNSVSPSPSVQTGTSTTISFETPGITSLTKFGSHAHILSDRILISAPECGNGRTNCRGGGVFVVLKQSSGQLQQVQAIIYPGVASTTTTFGDVITTHEDWLVISSKNGLYSSVTAGAVYLFHWNSVTQNYDRVRGLRARIAQEGLLFGSAVAMNGSYIAVGAPGYTHPITYTNAGAVFFFTFQSNVWVRYSVRVSAPIVNVDEFFGSSIACYSTLVAVGNRPIESALRVVYILQMTGVREWTVIQTMQDPTRDGFGWAVALVGNTLAVSCNIDSSEGSERGSVHIFEFNGSQFMDVQSISPIHHIEDNIHFGHAISMTASSLAIGTDTCPTGSNCSVQGRVFVYTFSNGGTWEYHGTYKKGESSGADRFGSAVSISGSTLVVGAPLGQGARGRHGKAFVIDI